MADQKKISALPLASEVRDNDVFVGNQDGVTKRMAAGSLRAYALAALGDVTGTDKGAQLVGWDGSTVGEQMNLSKKLADYAALRSYTGPATGFEITSPGIAGKFYVDKSDTTSADNNGTIFLDGNGRRVKRVFGGPVSVMWFGAKADYDPVSNTGTDDSPAFLAMFDSLLGEARYAGNVAGSDIRGKSQAYIPAGSYRINKQVSRTYGSTFKLPIEIIGDGISLTRIFVTSNQGFLRLELTGALDSYFRIANIAIYARSGVVWGHSGTAINLVGSLVGLARDGRLYLENLSVRPWQTIGFWFQNGIVANGFYYGTVKNCTVSGPWGNADSVAPNYSDLSPYYYMIRGIDLRDCYEMTVDNCRVWSCQIGYDLSNSADPGSEGGSVTRSGTSKVLVGLKRSCIGREPGFNISNCHFNFRDKGIWLENVHMGFVSDIEFFCENAAQLGTGGGAKDFYFRGVQNMRLSRIRHSFDGDTRRRFMDIGRTERTESSKISSHNINYDNVDFMTKYFSYGVYVANDNLDSLAAGNPVIRSMRNFRYNPEFRTASPSAVLSNVTNLWAVPEALYNGSNATGKQVHSLIIDDVPPASLGAEDANIFDRAGHGLVTKRDSAYQIITDTTAGKQCGLIVGNIENRRKFALLADSLTGVWNIYDGGTARFGGLNGDFNVFTKGRGVILASPNGTKYKITVNDDGAIVSTLAP